MYEYLHFIEVEIRNKISQWINHEPRRSFAISSGGSQESNQEGT